MDPSLNILFIVAAALSALTLALLLVLIRFIATRELDQTTLLTRTMLSPFNAHLILMILTALLLLVTTVVRAHLHMQPDDTELVKQIIDPIQTALFSIFGLVYIQFTWLRGFVGRYHTLFLISLFTSQFENSESSVRSVHPSHLCQFKRFLRLSRVVFVMSTASAILESALRNHISMESHLAVERTVQSIQAVSTLMPILFDGTVLSVFYKYMQETKLEPCDPVDPHFQLVFNHGTASFLFMTLGSVLHIISLMIPSQSTIVTTASLATLSLTPAILTSLKIRVHNLRARQKSINRKRVECAVGSQEMERLKQRSLDLHNAIQSRGSVENLARAKSRSNLSRNGSLDCVKISPKGSLVGSKSRSFDAATAGLSRSFINLQSSSRTPSKLDLHQSNLEPEQTQPSPRERASESFSANHTERRSDSVASISSFKSGKSIKKHIKSCKPLFPSPLHDALESVTGGTDSIKKDEDSVVLPSETILSAEEDIGIQESSERSERSSQWSIGATTGGSVERFKVKF